MAATDAVFTVVTAAGRLLFRTFWREVMSSEASADSNWSREMDT